ncbi:hypothetical protein RCG67_14700 [Kocuria sp. CPCC 205292]|uniref:hypothetical protein n=1 Tax=Kocuria cellulosilytica TaxID=3071451 RepID=UPI0034D6BBB4
MTKGKAPISGAIAIACGLLFATTVLLAVTVDLSWFTVASTLMTFVLTVLIWRRFRASDLEYRHRMERLDQRLSGGQ